MDKTNKKILERLFKNSFDRTKKLAEELEKETGYDITLISTVIVNDDDKRATFGYKYNLDVEKEFSHMLGVVNNAKFRK